MYIKEPEKIENKSMDIIDESLKDVFFNEDEIAIVKRMIHTTGDVEYRHIIDFRNDFIERAKHAIKSSIKNKEKTYMYTDTNMIASGINKLALLKANMELMTLVSDEDIRGLAKKRETTRSIVAIEEAVRRGARIFVIGNAPTALFRLIELKNEAKCDPLFVIGVPVGFVGAAESKEELRKTDIPQITTIGTKGGSNVAASIVNALLYECDLRVSI